MIKNKEKKMSDTKKKDCKKLKFYKYSATGNDFILFDFISSRECNHKIIKNISKISARRTGIGADGVIFLLPAINQEDNQEYSFEMKYFNADGSEGEMCGNGARSSIYHYFRYHQTSGGTVAFKAKNCIYHGDFNFMKCGQNNEQNLPRVQMTEVRDYKKINVDDLAKKYGFSNGAYLNTGVPHTVFEVADDINSVDVVNIGKAIRFEKRFEKGTNVNFFSIIFDEVSGKIANLEKKNLLKIRTYERGVEDETLSCGTGALASALCFCNNIAKTTNTINTAIISDSNVTVELITRGGRLFIDIDKNGNNYLSGEVVEVYQGVLNDC